MALTSSSVSYVYVIRGKNNVFHLAKMMIHPPLFSRILLIPRHLLSVYTVRTLVF